MTKPAVALLAAFLCIGCAPAASPAYGGEPARAPGRYVETLKVNGAERSYILRVPPAYDGRKALPLVVVLHGWTASAALAEQYTGFAAKADKEGFLLAVPDGVGNPKGWNTGFLNLGLKGTDDIAFIKEVLDKVGRDVRVDPNRVYVAGHSNGAMMAHVLAATFSHRIAAIGAVAGTIGLPKTGGGFVTIPEPKGPVSVMLIHGKKDPTVGYEPTAQAMLRGVSAPDAAKWWAERNAALRVARRQETNAGNVVVQTYERGKNGTEVVLVSIANGLHDWPGGLTRQGSETTTGIVAADLLWDFFKAHPKRR